MLSAAMILQTTPLKNRFAIIMVKLQLLCVFLPLPLSAQKRIFLMRKRRIDIMFLLFTRWILGRSFFMQGILLVASNEYIKTAKSSGTAPVFFYFFYIL